MRKLILGLCLFSATAFAKPEDLLSRRLVAGTQIKLLTDIAFAAGSGSKVFNVIDTYKPWRRHGEPNQEDSYCSFVSDNVSSENHVAKAGEMYEVLSIKPERVVGGTGTSIELARLDANGRTVQSPLTALVCIHTESETSLFSQNVASPRVSTIFRYEMYFDEFKSLMADYIAVQ